MGSEKQDNVESMKKSCSRVYFKGKENDKIGSKRETIQDAKIKKHPRKVIQDISFMVNALAGSMDIRDNASDEDEVFVTMKEILS